MRRGERRVNVPIASVAKITLRVDACSGWHLNRAAAARLIVLGTGRHIDVNSSERLGSSPSSNELRAFQLYRGARTFAAHAGRLQNIRRKGDPLADLDTKVKKLWYLVRDPIRDLDLAITHNSGAREDLEDVRDRTLSRFQARAIRAAISRAGHVSIETNAMDFITLSGQAVRSRLRGALDNQIRPDRDHNTSIWWHRREWSGFTAASVLAILALSYSGQIGDDLRTLSNASIRTAHVKR